MVRAPPSDVLIISEIYRCNDCGAGTEVFLYHAENADHQFFDPNDEDWTVGVERYEEQIENTECRSCGSVDTYPENYEDEQ